VQTKTKPTTTTTTTTTKIDGRARRSWDRLEARARAAAAARARAAERLESVKRLESVSPLPVLPETGRAVPVLEDRNAARAALARAIREDGLTEAVSSRYAAHVAAMTAARAKPRAARLVEALERLDDVASDVVSAAVAAELAQRQRIEGPASASLRALPFELLAGVKPVSRGSRKAAARRARK